jgi:hypothetical protein
MPKADKIIPACALSDAMWYGVVMVKTLELAITKAATLSEAAQEQLGRELLERIETLTELRAEIEIGVRELDAGLGEELDVEDVIKQARDEHARGA